MLLTVTASTTHRYSYGTVRSSCPAKLELEAIKRCLYYGDHWKDGSGKVVGLTMAEHTKKFIRLAWPTLYWHRWHQLILEEACRGGTLAVFGPASSQKTSTITLIMLSWYFAVPNEFTGLCSTTDLMRLELRIFGELKMRWKQARERYGWLAGNLIDSRQRITTDAKDSEGRDFRNGLLGIATKRGGEWQGLGDFSGLKNRFVVLAADECFIAGTHINTPRGTVPIESLKPGDSLLSAAGVDKVLAVNKRSCTIVVTVHATDGRSFTCTPEHPIFTQKGWIRACQLSQEHYMLSGYEAMSSLCEPSPTRHKQQQILRRLSKQGISVQILRETLQKELAEGDSKVLFPVVQREMVAKSAGIQGRALHAKAQREQQRTHEAVAQRQSRGIESRFGTYAQPQSDEARGDSDETKRDSSSYGLEASSSRWQWHRADQVGTTVARSFPRSCEQLSDQNRDESRQRIPVLLQSRPSFCGHQARSGSRRTFSQHDHASESGLEEREVLERGAWVDRVEVQESQNSGGDGSGDRRIEVYNLQVEKHPSYCVEGFLVHNCHMMEPGFLQGANNLKSNNNAGRFFGFYLGNLVDIETPLGESAEPDCGWDALPDSDVSRVYKTKFFNGRAIQLVGKDSPNFDYPEGSEPYPGLIGRRFIEELKHDCGEGSPIYIAQAGGTIPRSSLANRVLTKEVCLKFNAFEPVVWGNEPLTRLYSADISYTVEHGDRTVGIPMAFGRDIEGKLRLAFLELPKVFGFSKLEGGTTVEESHALQAKAEMDRLSIPYEHFFFDGTGRSSFTAAAMRAIGTQIKPVEFGGPASDRPNFLGRKYPQDYRDQAKRGELLPCREVFDKFVTELWFAWRYLVEADQLRALSEDTAREGYMRLWKLVAGNKMSVEPKKEMKVRLNRSPDLADALVVGIEGARRLGFVIGKDMGARNSRGASWLQKLKQDYRAEVAKNNLSYN
jgi:hypothetical protein